MPRLLMTSPLCAADPLLFLVVAYRASEILESRVQHAMNSWEIHSIFGHLNENINAIYLAYLLTTKYLNILRHLKYHSLLQTIASGILHLLSLKELFFFCILILLFILLFKCFCLFYIFIGPSFRSNYVKKYFFFGFWYIFKFSMLASAWVRFLLM